MIIKEAPAVSFFTPIVFDKKDKTVREKIQEFVDGYFHLFGKEAYIQENGETTFSKPSPTWKIYVKAAVIFASYLTVVIPALMFVAKIILRADFQKAQPIDHLLEFGQKYQLFINKVINEISSNGEKVTDSEIENAIKDSEDFKQKMKKKSKSLSPKLSQTVDDTIKSMHSGIALAISKKITLIDAPTFDNLDEVMAKFSYYRFHLNKLSESNLKKQAFDFLNDAESVINRMKAIENDEQKRNQIEKLII